MNKVPFFFNWDNPWQYLVIPNNTLTILTYRYSYMSVLYHSATFLYLDHFYRHQLIVNILSLAFQLPTQPVLNMRSPEIQIYKVSSLITLLVYLLLASAKQCIPILNDTKTIPNKLGIGWCKFVSTIHQV